MEAPYELWPSQADDLKRIRKAGYKALVSAEMGYGKTNLAVECVKDSGAQQVLIIAPKATHELAWGETIERQTGGEKVRIVGRKNKAQKQAYEDLEWGKPGWYIMTPQFFTRSASDTMTPEFLIVDEIHQINAYGTKGLEKLAGYTARHKNPLRSRVDYVIGLSGTLARNKFERMWGNCRTIWPELSGYGEVAQTPYSSWQDYRMASHYEHWFEYSPKTGRPQQKKAKIFDSERYPGQLMKDMPCVIVHYRREKCCKFHPNGFMPFDKPREIQEIVDLTPAQRKHVTGLEEEALAWMDDNPLVVKLPLTKQLRIRQAILAEASVETWVDPDTEEPKQKLYYERDAKSPYADRVLELLEELGDEPVLVFTSSQIFAEFLTNRLKDKGVAAAEVSGKRNDRDKVVAGFGKEHRVIVATIDALGTGTDGLQKVSNTEIWIDRSQDRTNNTQGYGRLDRPGQTKQVLRIELFDDMGYSEKTWNRQASDSAILDESLRKG